MGSRHLVMVHCDSHATNHVACLCSLAVLAPVAVLEGKELIQAVVWVLHCQALKQALQGCLHHMHWLALPGSGSSLQLHMPGNVHCIDVHVSIVGQQ